MFDTVIIVAPFYYISRTSACIQVILQLTFSSILRITGASLAEEVSLIIRQVSKLRTDCGDKSRTRTSPTRKPRSSLASLASNTIDKHLINDHYNIKHITIVNDS